MWIAISSTSRLLSLFTICIWMFPFRNFQNLSSVSKRAFHVSVIRIVQRSQCRTMNGVQRQRSDLSSGTGSKASKAPHFTFVARPRIKASFYRSIRNTNLLFHERNFLPPTIISSTLPFPETPDIFPSSHDKYGGI